MQVVYLNGNPGNIEKEYESEAEKGRESASGALSSKLLMWVPNFANEL